MGHQNPSAEVDEPGGPGKIQAMRSGALRFIRAATKIGKQG